MPPGNDKLTASNAFDLLFAKIWRVAQNMTAELMRRKSTLAPVEPSMTAAPLIVNEPIKPTNVVPFPASAPLFAGNGGAQLPRWQDIATNKGALTNSRLRRGDCGPTWVTILRTPD